MCGLQFRSLGYDLGFGGGRSEILGCCGDCGLVVLLLWLWRVNGVVVGGFGFGFYGDG